MIDWEQVLAQLYAAGYAEFMDEIHRHQHDLPSILQHVVRAPESGNSSCNQRSKKTNCRNGEDRDCCHGTWLVPKNTETPTSYLKP